MSCVNIEIWSDIACPWCWIGKRSLEAAIASSDHEVVLRWRAFELNPDAPTDVSAVLDGTDYAEDVRNDEDLARKLGITGVPCFVFTQLNEGISGAQPPEVLGDAMNRAAQR